VIARARELLSAHPRHVVLAGLVAGLLAGPVAPGLALVAAVLLVPLLAPRPWLAAAVVLSAASGAYLAQERVAAREHTALRPAAGGEHVGAAVILESPVRTGRSGARTATAALRGDTVLLRLPRGDRSTPPVGSILAVTGTLRPPDRHGRLLHAHATLRADTLSATGRRRGGLHGAVDGLRDRAQAALAGELRPSSTALLRGMVLGDDSALPVPLREAMRDAGLSHLVAASGQNVLLLTTLVLLLGAAAGAPWSWRLAAAIAVVALYVPLAGGGPSIQRAAVMGVAGLLAALAGRAASRWYAVLLAAVVTLALDPRAAGDLGWQLSFAAVLGLLAIGPRLRLLLIGRGVPGPLADATATTVAATLATAPLLALTFGETSLVAVPANVLAAPLVGPIMWLGFVAAAIGQASVAAGNVVAELAALPLAGIVLIGETAARAPGATARLPPWLVAAVVALLAGAVVSARVRALAPGLAIGLLALGFATAPRPDPVLARPGGARVAFLDVGQGDATVLQHGSHAVLIDAGPPDGPVLARLRRVGVRRLDILVVTHAQDDHDGGAAAVLAAMPVDRVLDGRDGRSSPGGERMARIARDRGIGVVRPDAGQVLRAGPIELRVRGPRSEPAALRTDVDPNDRAIVLEARIGRLRILLPADAESGVLSGLGLGATDVLKVSHHGSADEALPGLLVRIRPRIAVISAGRGNRFGHPATGTLAALRAAVPTVLRTDRDGTIVLDTSGSALRVRTLG